MALATEQRTPTFPVAPERSPAADRFTKSFGFKVALRLFGVCCLGCLTGFLLFDSPYWMASIWTGLATAGLFYESVRFVTLSQRKLTAFLQSIQQGDFTVTFTEKRFSDDYALNRAFNQLNETYKNLRAEKESQHHLLQVIVSDAAVPMVCFETSNEEVYLINDAAKKLFEVEFLQRIESLRRVELSLPDFLRSVRDGEKASLKLVREGKAITLSVTSSHLRFGDKDLKLVAFTDVSSELAARDAEAWQKLLRVLTHEISNSAIPLSTLSAYIREMLVDAQVENRELSPDERKDLMESLQTIDQRSQSLKQFVTSFKSINQVPEPDITSIPVIELISELNRLFRQDFEKSGIEMRTHVPAGVLLNGDKNLTMLVLINLIKNAMEAMSNMKEDKSITLTVEREGAHFVHVHVADTGCGIQEEDLEQIFVPFFSTKKGGSGIGLSIARQIMQKQKGDLTVISTVGRGSVFTASFLS